MAEAKPKIHTTQMGKKKQLWKHARDYYLIPPRRAEDNHLNGNIISGITNPNNLKEGSI